MLVSYWARILFPLLALAFGGVLATSCDGDEEDLSAVEERAPTQLPEISPLATPPPCQGPCEGPIVDEGPEPPPPPILINGRLISLPEGARLEEAIMDPGGIGHIFRFKDSWLTFDANGWIVSDGIMPADEGFYATTLDELHQAGSPAVVNGKQVRVPRGVSYHPPVLNKNLTEGWLGPPEEAPELHVFKRGTSVLSFEADGTLVADKVAAEDERDFSALRQELASAANE